MRDSNVSSNMNILFIDFFPDFLGKHFLQLVRLIEFIQLVISTNELAVDKDGGTCFVIVFAPSSFRELMEISIRLVDLVEGGLEANEKVVGFGSCFGIISEDDDLVVGDEVFEFVSHCFCVYENEIFCC